MGDSLINYFFIFIYIFSIIYGLLTGRVEAIQSSLLSMPKNAFTLFLNIFVSLIFFEGILKIAVDSGIIRILTKCFNPLLRFLFPRLKDSDALDYISLNFMCNILGIGGASTGAGLKAMELLNTNNNLCTPEMTMFLSLNASGFCILPQTVIALRESYGSLNPSVVIFPIVLISFCNMLFAYILNKLLVKYES